MPATSSKQQGISTPDINISDNDFDNYTWPQLRQKYSLQKIVRYYLDKDFPIDKQDEEGYGLIHILAQAGDYKLIRCLMPKNPNSDLQTNNGFTPLHLATVNRHYDAVETLVYVGADLNIQNLHGQTPLHLAVITYHINMAVLFLERGADLNIRDNTGYTPVQWAILQEHFQLASTLLRKDIALGNTLSETTTELYVAIINGDIYSITTLLQTGAQINAQDKNGNTPLHLAINLLLKDRENYTKIIKLLKQNGANQYIPNHHEITVAHIAQSGSNSNDLNNPYTVILKILQPSTDNTYPTPPALEANLTVGMQTNFLELDPAESNMNVTPGLKATASLPTIVSVCSLAPESKVQKAFNSLALESKVQKAFNSLKEKWSAAKESYNLEFSSFKAVSDSEYRQEIYIRAFREEKMFKLLQAIARDLATNSQEFNEILTSLNSIVFGKNPPNDFENIAAEMFEEDNIPGNYTIKEGTKFLLKCISLTELAELRKKSAYTFEILEFIQTSIAFASEILLFLGHLKEKPHQQIEIDYAIKGSLNHWEKALQQPYFIHKSKTFIDTAKNYCQELIANINSIDQEGATPSTSHTRDGESQLEVITLTSTPEIIILEGDTTEEHSTAALSGLDSFPH